ncbi:hypothetical protein B0H13DRAFT_2400016, partial [Mycena leptocephala]
FSLRCHCGGEAIHSSCVAYAFPPRYRWPPRPAGAPRTTQERRWPFLATVYTMISAAALICSRTMSRVWAHPQNIHRWPHTYHLCCLPAHRDRLRLDALPGLSSTQKRPHTSDDQLARTGRTTHSTTVNPSPSPALSLYLIAIQPSRSALDATVCHPWCRVLNTYASIRLDARCQMHPRYEAQQQLGRLFPSRLPALRGQMLWNSTVTVRHSASIPPSAPSTSRSALHCHFPIAHATSIVGPQLFETEVLRIWMNSSASS